MLCHRRFIENIGHYRGNGNATPSGIKEFRRIIQVLFGTQLLGVETLQCHGAIVHSAETVRSLCLNATLRPSSHGQGQHFHCADTARECLVLQKCETAREPSHENPAWCTGGNSYFTEDSGVKVNTLKQLQQSPSHHTYCTVSKCRVVGLDFITKDCTQNRQK